ncbi:hypothetical protein [Mycetocola saprophilus]|uniref:hypothetical protein n=1 Tax=Mycetocola saprophilus TaxID=76636 RepID=UPI0012DC6A4B|nr:hypothetical protein [Mycetocola saprophilus]
MTYQTMTSDHQLTAFLEGCTARQVERERYGNPDRSERPSSPASKRVVETHQAKARWVHFILDRANGPERLAAAVDEIRKFDQTKNDIAAYSRRKAGK